MRSVLVESATSGWPELLREHREAVVSEWQEIVGRSLAGRMTAAESAHDIGEIFDGLVEGASASGQVDVRGTSFDGLRSLLSDLARAGPGRASRRPRPR